MAPLILVSYNHKFLWDENITLILKTGIILAPPDCLKYFTSATGQVNSFNRMEIAGTATRQLNNQNYNICFRTELVSSQVCFILLLLDQSKSILQMNFQLVLNRR